MIALALVPRNPGERIKTDRRDARKLAEMHRMGPVVTVAVARDLVGILWAVLHPEAA